MTDPSGAEKAAGELRARLDRSFLYLVTPETVQTGDLDGFLARVLEAGVDMVQLRCKQMEARPLLEHCSVVRRRTAQFGALFIVNDRVDVAVAAGADGVHLGQDDLPVEEARRQMGPVPIIGVSTHSRRQLLAALDGDADYAAVGPVYATPTKPGRPGTGLDLVGFAADRASKPVFAIGGIDPSNIAAVVEAGANRVSVVRALTASDDPAGAARALTAALRAAPRGTAL
ncbi:MAG TPA: thiamine phosphate synthase [Actinomycetota bacterium]|nr:thiamine phosphate synthase [Actinomycetota bacterium]